MFPSHDQTPVNRPDGGPLDVRGPLTRRARSTPRGRRAAAALAALGILAVSLAAGAPASAAVATTASTAVPTAEEPTPPPPISAPAGEHTLEQPDVDAWLDGLLPAALESNGIAGAVVSVVDDGEIVTTRGYGHADTGTTGGEAVPVDAENTLFRPGSVSKLFTATAVMQLVESGDLDLDADVAEYLDFDVPRRFDEPITLRNLLTHTAGFEEVIDGLIGFGDRTPVLRDALADGTAGADLRAGHRSRVLELRQRARRLHRPAGQRRAVRGVRPAQRPGARRDDVVDLRAAPAGRAERADVEGVRLVVRGPRAVRDRRHAARRSAHGVRPRTWPASCWPSSASQAPGRCSSPRRST